FEDPYTFNPDRYLGDADGTPHYGYGAGRFKILGPMNEADAAITDGMEVNALPTALVVQPKKFKCRFEPRNLEDLELWIENIEAFNECHNDADTFHACFMNHYYASPAFFSGSLLDACKAAFNSQDINERRPLLIYIHHDKKKMIERLLENYIVWPWDITFESNRNRLSTIWETTFSTPLFNDFSVEKCPMLIGITRRPTEIKSWIPTSKYQFTSLLKGHTLIRSQEKSIMKTLLSELSTFKDECDNIEQTW
ncbi:unnamed protein product, partial [Adineta steineri]